MKVFTTLSNSKRRPGALRGCWRSAACLPRSPNDGRRPVSSPSHGEPPFAPSRDKMKWSSRRGASVAVMERRAIVIRGIVQGVGFRPFVYSLATRLHLGGFVKNRAGSVLIEVEGAPASLERFCADLTRKPPPLAQIEQLSWEPRPPCGEQQFRIVPSD